MMFGELIISDKNKQILKKQVKRNNTSHCYIFTGPEGTQKKKTALEFSKALLCNSNNRPCGRCRSCNKLDCSNHPDLIDILPEDKSIKIDQVREMQRKMNIKPYESDYKVFIINNSETMGIPAQNSLLKSLEEPQRNTVVILISKSLVSLLPTILSRSQIIKFTPLDKRKFNEKIESIYSDDSINLKDLNDLSQGCIDKAVKLIEEEEKVKFYTYAKEQLYAIIKGEYHRIFQFSKWIKDNKVDQGLLIQVLILVFSDLIKAKFNTSGDIYEEINQYLTYQSINGIIQEIIELENSMKYNINVQLQIEKTLLRIQEEKLINGESRRRTV